MTRLLRFTCVTFLCISGLSACGGGGGTPDPVIEPPVDTTLTWDDDNWDERNWQ